MKPYIFVPLLVCIPGITALISCGGTGATHANPPAMIATNAFVDMAKTASCADLRNRLFVIDQKQVFWDKAGSCADASYSQILYGDTPQTILCTNADSIAGPRTSCADATSIPLFTIIIKNLDKADLGLGNTHQVQQIFPDKM